MDTQSFIKGYFTLLRVQSTVLCENDLSLHSGDPLYSSSGEKGFNHLSFPLSKHPLFGLKQSYIFQRLTERSRKHSKITFRFYRYFGLLQSAFALPHLFAFLLPNKELECSPLSIFWWTCKDLISYWINALKHLLWMLTPHCPDCSVPAANTGSGS